ncbi:MAG: hypothetical protein COX57_00320 [Alphaproteobacteria bacterium CG_4_10_14_0_2_um_filter_63_37]|nr:MAG: hypothetical protein AUJ55_12025 [Proteobacteria bacterium CG1_02_64_396]PJA26051.1 MAG: hypothetical protein COX57_00320 [Alphaproteobacteria bacterium CG_4_10_14_0_2_um_filter_63_37]
MSDSLRPRSYLHRIPGSTPPSRWNRLKAAVAHLRRMPRKVSVALVVLIGWITIQTALPSAPEPKAKRWVSDLEIGAVDPETAMNVRGGDLVVALNAGQNLEQLFSAQGWSVAESYAVAKAAKPLLAVGRWQAGVPITVGLEGSLPASFRYPDGTRDLLLERHDEGWQGQWQEHPLELRVTAASGEIRSSLWEAAQEAGLPENLIMEMAELFAWDIDFSRDLRPGDRFSLLFEERFDHGKSAGAGPILMVRFTNEGQTYTAVRFEASAGQPQYFTEEGKPIVRAFLRAPLKFSRISSSYGMRYHPIQKTWKQHTGIDYAAASGTPVRAVGDGRVTFRGWKGGYGNFVVIRHNATYESAYGHLRGFARGLSVGDRVQQGEIIGYVGMTGLATGPHLHFEFRKNGTFINPRSIKPPPTAGLVGERAQHFAQQREHLGRILESQLGG